MNHLIWAIVAGVATIVTCALIVVDGIPLGVEDQWRWGRIEYATLWADYFTAATVVALYLVYVAVGSRQLDGTAWSRGASLAGMVLAGFFVQMSMQQVGFGLAKWPFVLYSESSSGYYTAAKRDVSTAGEFLAHYDQFQDEYRERFGPLHLATHPPGLVLLQFGSVRLCEKSPGFTRFLLELQPRSIADGFRAVAEPATIARADQASIWLVALLSQLASAATVIPIYCLARRGGSPAAAWFAAALWPLVPAVTVFMPKSDVLYPLFAAACVALGTGGRTAAGRWANAAAGGLILWAGMFLSFALVTVLPLTILAITVADGWPAASTIRATVERIAGFVLSFSAASLVLLLLTGHAILATWLRCYRIHAMFYEAGQIGSNRTYWPWVLVNPIEFAVAAGVPLTVAAVVGTQLLTREVKETERIEEAARFEAGRTLRAKVGLLGTLGAFWLTLLVLDFSGKNLGEVARLWMFLMPFPAVAVAAAVDEPVPKRWWAIALLVLQGVQAIVMAANVQGFYDPASVRVGGQ